MVLFVLGTAAVFILVFLTVTVLFAIYGYE